MFKLMLSAVCVLATAAPLLAETMPKNAFDISGRWQGKAYAVGGAADELTLDVVACGTGWCGIKVEANETCGHTALKLAAGGIEDERTVFKGTLALARETEPYVIESYLVAEADGAPPKLQMIGDTGGTFRIFRRSFPFEASLARTRDAICKSTQTLSMLDTVAD